eukprot:gene18831-12214_t
MRAVGVALLAAAVAADIEVSWSGLTVDPSITGSASFGSCSGTLPDPSGSCTVNWGQTGTAKVDGSGTKDINSGTVSADVKIDGLIGFKPSCPLCGTGNCTITVPIVKKKIEVPLSPCPIKAGPVSVSQDVTVSAAPSGLPKAS